jgi:hypothetical protein
MYDDRDTRGYAAPSAATVERFALFGSLFYDWTLPDEEETARLALRRATLSPGRPRKAPTASKPRGRRPRPVV